jgi:plastocyanin
MTKNIFLFVAVLAGLVLAGCMAPSGDEDVESVEMVNTRFQPATITVPAGTTVEWKNMDPMIHNVVADEGDWGMAANQFLNQGETFRYTFDTPGTYTYHCAPHAGQNEDGMWAGMTGTVVVTNGDNQTA